MAGPRNFMEESCCYLQQLREAAKDEVPKESHLTSEQEKCIKRYSFQKMSKHTGPFENYLNKHYGLKQEDIKKIINPDEDTKKGLQRTNSKLPPINRKDFFNDEIKKQTQQINTKSNWIASAFSFANEATKSYRGCHVNGDSALEVLFIIHATKSMAERSREEIPVLVTGVLKELHDVYKKLPQRNSVSIANLFYYAGMASAEPEVAAAIKTIFKEYDIDIEKFEKERERVHQVMGKPKQVLKKN